MTEPTGTEAHPAYNRELDTADLMAAPRGFRGNLEQEALIAFAVIERLRGAWSR